MNKGFYVYAYWGVLTFLIYSTVGILTEHEFLPNVVWLFTGKPTSGFCSQCRTDFILIFKKLIATPIWFWLRSKTTGQRALVSKKNLAVVTGIVLILGLIVFFITLQNEKQEEREAQIQYNNRFNGQ